MNLIQQIKAFGRFGVRISRFSGNSEYQCLSSQVVTLGGSIKIPLGANDALDVMPDGLGFYFCLSMGEIDPHGAGRYEFGETKARYFAYKFSDTLVEFLKVEGGAGDVVMALPDPLKPDDAPSRQWSGDYSDEWRYDQRCAGNGYTRAAHTHKN
ncbi:hypothetical protein AU074_13690 [Pseudomonas sp. ATCC PTA-122608]|uniref:hypothetical protein n=1 Tax=Pseudomonas sp. ATCC PTA-122608 TaxID=1771311 RepID=UPI00096BCDDB|nr:hypothetical protein [Pseudomonas sp. ATCC PTA-122608]OLY72222.1 hypothetical protein AU074_13690 [Pseudomonas sp. ATCC PTA-122608]